MITGGGRTLSELRWHLIQGKIQQGEKAKEVEQNWDPNNINIFLVKQCPMLSNTDIWSHLYDER